jgi:O-antigen/teichoic acid export membrane protein
MADQPEETEEERWQRNFSELLQELRVAQTGVQILFAFLLTIVFNARFGELSEFQQDVYLVALLAAAASVSMLIGPVALHRMLFRQRRKPEIVRTAHRMASAGLVFMVVAMVSSVFLVVDFIVNKTAAGIVTGVVAVWFVLWWGVIPWLRREDPEGPARSSLPPSNNDG